MSLANTFSLTHLRFTLQRTLLQQFYSDTHFLTTMQGVTFQAEIGTGVQWTRTFQERAFFFQRPFCHTGVSHFTIHTLGARQGSRVEQSWLGARVQRTSYPLSQSCMMIQFIDVPFYFQATRTHLPWAMRPEWKMARWLERSITGRKMRRRTPPEKRCNIWISLTWNYA